MSFLFVCTVIAGIVWGFANGVQELIDFMVDSS